MIGASEHAVLLAVRASEPGVWLPSQAQLEDAQKLCRRRLLRRAGLAAVPPYALYALTEKGIQELETLSGFATS